MPQSLQQKPHRKQLAAAVADSSLTHEPFWQNACLRSPSLRPSEDVKNASPCRPLNTYRTLPTLRFPVKGDNVSVEHSEKSHGTQNEAWGQNPNLRQHGSARGAWAWRRARPPAQEVCGIDNSKSGTKTLCVNEPSLRMSTG